MRATEHAPNNGRDDQQNRGSRRNAFSLIELLTVVAVILVLMGITLKVTSFVRSKGATGRTTFILEAVKNALSAFYTVYGAYPAGNVGGSTVYEFLTDDTNSLPAQPDEGKRADQDSIIHYLWTGYGRGADDTEAKRWQHYLKGINLVIDNEFVPTPSTKAGIMLNLTYTVCYLNDDWGNTLLYECNPPYQTYRLWSCGPDGVNNNGTNDDLGVTAPW